MRWKLKAYQIKLNKMKTEIKNLFKLAHYFKVKTCTDNSITYNLKIPSLILIKNVHKNWLQYIHAKTRKQIPVYLNDSYKKIEYKLPVFGFIKQNFQVPNEETVLEYRFDNSNTTNSRLQFNLVVPQEDAMQYFVKWQRYRKYWWSSISTTPSLFAVNDIKYEENSANVDIVARLPCGEHAVENVAINFKEKDQSSCLCCSISLENAMFILLLDGLNNNTKEEYLRLHRKVAPYKISFALDIKDTEHKKTLNELATLLHHKLESNRISAWLPDFSLPYDTQIKENLHLGVSYTAILTDETLINGIFRLMSSGTMLGEQVHVADFHKYAAILFEK